MREYTVTLAMTVFTDSPLDADGFLKALRNYYLDNYQDGRDPMPTENVNYWLQQMTTGAVRLAAHDPVWEEPMRPEDEDYERWPGGVNPKFQRACNAADAAEREVKPRVKGLDVIAVELTQTYPEA